MTKKTKMEFAPLNVVTNVENYLKKAFGDTYKVHSVFRASNHPDDHYLYMVIARREKDSFMNEPEKGSWACWTSWNETTQSLNFGHYHLETKDIAYEICRERYNDIYA